MAPPIIISHISRDAIIYMLRSEGLMMKSSFAVRSLATVTKPFVQVAALCKCHVEGHEKQ